MNTFPFSEAEWSNVEEAARAIVEATSIEDEILEAAQTARLEALLEDLRARYGEHPILLETKADFTNDVGERMALYERAKGISLANGLPTLSIRLSMARVFLDELGQPAAARRELLGCHPELDSDPDTSIRREWTELLAQATRRALISSASSPAGRL